MSIFTQTSAKIRLSRTKNYHYLDMYIWKDHQIRYLKINTKYLQYLERFMMYTHIYKGCRWTVRLISTKNYFCDTLIEVEKSIKECLDRSTYTRIWKTFFKNMMEGKLNQRSFKGRQSGGRIAGMYSKKPCIHATR